MSAESFDNPFVTQTLNAAGRAAIAMEGITKLAMSVVEAQESGSPTWASNNSAILAVNMAETSGTANDPTLTFTYSAAGPAVAVLAHHKKLSLRY